MKPEIRQHPGMQEMSEAAAHFIVEHARARVRERAMFTLVISGGKTPILLYETLAQERFIAALPWRQTHVFWADERCVPSDHSHSNFAMAFTTLLSRVPLPPENVHRIPGEMGSPEAGV